MAKASKKAAPKKATPRKRGAQSQSSAGPDLPANGKAAPHKGDAPVCTIEKDQSDYAQ